MNEELKTSVHMKEKNKSDDIELILVILLMLCMTLPVYFAGFAYAYKVMTIAYHGYEQNIDTKPKEVQVKITDVYIEERIYPVYNVEVTYNDEKYVIRGKETYNKYKDRVGENVTGILLINSNKDGTETPSIISLE